MRQAVYKHLKSINHIQNRFINFIKKIINRGVSIIVTVFYGGKIEIISKASTTGPTIIKTSLGKMAKQYGKGRRKKKREELEMLTALIVGAGPSSVDLAKKKYY